MFKKKDLMQELTDYIIGNLKKGYTEESLRWALIDQGYSRLEVEKALKRANRELASHAPILKKTGDKVRNNRTKISNTRETKMV